MVEAHEKVVEAQFGPQARAYVESAVHASGADLDAVEALVRKLSPERALDLGAGGGHVAYVMARHARRVIAADLSREMLAAVAATARGKGLSNLETVEAPAERLPSGTRRSTCREPVPPITGAISCAGLREARRAMKRNGRAVFIDAYSPAPPLFDTHLQAVELLRDHSHVRNYTCAQWIEALGRAGFALEACRTWKLRMDFPVWTARMRTPEENVRAIRALQIAASSETKAHFAIEPDGSFLLDIMIIEASAA